MSELQGIARFKFRPGKVEEFKRLSAQCMKVVRAKEPDTLMYETYFNDDETEAVVLERFRNSEALLFHGGNMAPFMDAILATADVHGELLGPVNDELRANLGEGGPVQLFANLWLAK